MACDEANEVVDPSHPLEILGAAMALREMVERVTSEEFSWHDAHYDDHSELGRELLFLIANHEWVRATSEVVDVVRSDVIETTIKTDIDLSLIKHEAFRGKSGQIWLPIAVLPPQIRQRQLEPDLFATVADAAGRLLPLLPADDLGHQMAAALAEIIVNMAVAHWPNWRDTPFADALESDPTPDNLDGRPVATRDQRVLLSAAIYRLLRREPRKIGVPVEASGRFPVDEARQARTVLVPGRKEGPDDPPADTGLTEPGFSAGSFRLSEARKRLLRLLDRYTAYLAQNAIPKESTPSAEAGPESESSRPEAESLPEAEFVPELAERAIRIVQAVAASTIVVVPIRFETEPTVLTVRVPTRNLKPGWKTLKLGNSSTWRISPRSWLVRPSGSLAIDILLPTADADRQIQVRLADGVSFESAARQPGQPVSPSSHLDIAVTTPPPLLELAASVRPILELSPPPLPPWLRFLKRPLIDLAQAKIAAASHTLDHYRLSPGPEASAPSQDPEPSDRKKPDPHQKYLENLYQELPKEALDDTKLADLRQRWKQEGIWKLPLFRRASVDQFDPRTLVARVDMIEEVAQRATPKSAVIYADVHVDDRGYLADARASTLMSLLLMTGVLAFLGSWYLVTGNIEPQPEVLAIVLVLFVTVQAGRIERPDRSTLHGQLSGTGSLLIAGSVFPAAMLAVALAFEPIWWVKILWAGVSVAVQLGFFGLMVWGPLTPSYQAQGWPRVGQRREYETERLYYGHFEALRSDYWRNTTADALTTGRPAYGYLITQNSSAESTPPEVEKLLQENGGRGSAGEPGSVLALLHSGTQLRAVTFVVLRGERKTTRDTPGAPVTEWKDLHLDADRLAPADNISSTVDLFVGVDRHTLPLLSEHPVIKVLQIARNKLITLEAQLPAPTTDVPDLNRQWARVRVALRDTRDIYRLTDFLDEIYDKIVVPGHAGDLIAVQAAPAAPSRVLRKSAGTAREEEEQQVPERPLLWGGDLDVSTIPAIVSERDDAHSWRQIAIYADARSNIESELTQCLPEEYQHYQLAHLNYAVLHGTAEIILLLHQPATSPTSGTPAAAPAASANGRPPSTVAPAGDYGTATGQPRVVINNEASLRELGPLTQHPMLRIRYRTPDQPGTFLNIVQATREFLEHESPEISREQWSISYARVQVVTGQIALGHLTIRLHGGTQDRERWNSGKLDQMAREVSDGAARLAAAGQKTSPSGSVRGNRDPVVSVEFVSEDPPISPVSGEQPSAETAQAG
ncbi:MAG: hypothetical protein JO016_02285 [Actinobacteria bacterium]|nr:hypothetical protein [Actinomycetota bacterium]